MIKRKCENCKYWTVDPHGNKTIGDCINPNFLYYSGFEKEKEDLSENLIYWDYEGYTAGFQTGRHFGCCHWGKKK